jgi:hypothetical protein
MANETCWTIVHEAARGNAAARSTFSRTYVPAIRSYLEKRWRGSALQAQVDDGLQDVFVECLRPGGVLEQADPDRGEFRGLLYGVVRNVARRFEKIDATQREQRPDESVHFDDLPHQAEALSAVFDRAWAQALLREALVRHAGAARSGDAEYRRRYRILRLRHQRGLAVRDIAARFREADVDKIHNQYRRARRDFRAFLREVVAANTGVGDSAVDAECRRLTELLT